MENKQIYVYNEGTSQKFWEYSINGSNIHYRYGRIGLPESSISPPVIKPYRISDLQKKVQEKTSKGYQSVSYDDYERMHEIARDLGHQYKITKIEFISSKNNRQFTFGPSYDPDLGVVVEVTNSWSKEIMYFYIGRNDSGLLNGFTWATGIAASIYNGGMSSSQIRAIKKVLNDLSATVQKIVTETFAAIGARSLNIDGESSEELEVIKSHVHKQKSFSIADDAVVTKFASMGDRVLLL